MKQNGERRNYISGLLALVTAGIFAVCVLAAVLAGTNTYNQLAERDRLTYESRTCTGFLAARVRQAAGPEAVSIEDFGGSDALAFYETVEGEDYVTLLYCYEGWLMEYFAVGDGVDMASDMELGSRILPAETMKLQLDGGLLRAEITLAEEPVPLEVILALRGREEAAHEE